MTNIINHSRPDEIPTRADVFEYFPNTFNDKRGGFSQKMTNTATDDWFQNMQWIKQVNCSYSEAKVFRGFHAQRGSHCQAKLVENMSIDEVIYDVIIDARPDFATFGDAAIFKLQPVNSKRHNMLWVPRGFLHAFAVPKNNKNIAVFQYFCDNTYCKESEVGVKPSSVLKAVTISEAMQQLDKDAIDTFRCDLTFSEKDEQAADLYEFLPRVYREYEQTGKLWYVDD